MAIQDRTKAIGDGTKLLVALGLSGTRPASTAFKRIGALTSKGYDMSPNTVESNADDQKGFVEMYVTGATFSIKASGEARVKDIEEEFGYDNLTDYFMQTVNEQGQPTLWVRYIRGSKCTECYMVITSLNEDSSSKEIVTYDLEFGVANSDTVTRFDIDPSTGLPVI